jgi:hypothetical protein
MDAATPASPTASPSPAQTGVALWNPNAAALWSIIFTPVFGAYLHALNWRALGDKDRESASMNWVYAGGALLLVLLLIEVVVPGDSNKGDRVSRTLELAFLLAWYFGSARDQVKWVKDELGGSFTRKSWRQPLLIGVAGIAIYIVLMIAISAVIGIRYL